MDDSAGPVGHYLVLISCVYALCACKLRVLECEQLCQVRPPWDTNTDSGRRTNGEELTESTTTFTGERSDAALCSLIDLRLQETFSTWVSSRCCVLSMQR